MATVTNQVLATVNAPYGVAVSAEQLALCIADASRAQAYPGPTFAFFSEVAPHIQRRFIVEMGVNAHSAAVVARMLSQRAGYPLPLA
jgi:ABC-type enterobactin transport system permease subunit